MQLDYWLLTPSLVWSPGTATLPCLLIFHEIMPAQRSIQGSAEAHMHCSCTTSVKPGTRCCRLRTL